MSLIATVRTHLSENSQMPPIFGGWVTGTRPYITLSYSDAPASPSMSAKAMREAFLNIDIWHRGPSILAAEQLSELVVDELDEMHLEDTDDSRIIYRFSDVRSIHVPEADQNIAHWNVSFSVRWYRAAFVEKLINRG